MKTDRHIPFSRFPSVKLAWMLAITLFFAFAVVEQKSTRAQNATSEIRQPPPAPGSYATLPAPTLDPASQPQALSVLHQVIDRIANGAAFDARVRQRVRTEGRTIVGLGTYEQAGGGSGRFQLQMTMLDGQGKHTLQQISDGRLAWTRTQIADQIQLNRVDVGWLEEGARLSRAQSPVVDAQHATERPIVLSPRTKVGGWTEMLGRLEDDYVLKLGLAQLQSQPLYVLTGTLKPSRREEILQSSGGDRLPDLYPARVNVAIAKTDDPQTGFGKGLPVRIEFFSEKPVAPPKHQTADKAPSNNSSNMISLIELYSVRPIDPPPVERFRFENQDATVDIINETARYEQMFGIRVTAKQRARHRW
ncbi:hypothetical protein [Stieleria varia]|uniref:Uncharacterized protein n=1 Tax=Stieleria varia TaxID=2528005 RepID=A0A5C6B576_9BACT|nr:hypothetical protein [Stieleria varia]TWU07445.1 hypothetical protein Pla52n_00180 [Stieleria varia]